MWSAATAELPPCLAGMGACASAHHWARELMAIGHEVRLMPPACVKPYVKRGKTDAAYAEAICEAVTRPTMRFVAVKSVEQQAVLMLHKSRDLTVRQRTMLINALRGHLAEYGIMTGLGAGGVTASLKALHEEQDRLPAHAGRRSQYCRSAEGARQRDRPPGSADPGMASQR
jgi:transposase